MKFSNETLRGTLAHRTETEWKCQFLKKKKRGHAIQAIGFDFIEYQPKPSHNMDLVRDMFDDFVYFPHMSMLCLVVLEAKNLL